MRTFDFQSVLDANVVNMAICNKRNHSTPTAEEIKSSLTLFSFLATESKKSIPDVYLTTTEIWHFIRRQPRPLTQSPSLSDFTIGGIRTEHFETILECAKRANELIQAGMRPCIAHWFPLTYQEVEAIRNVWKVSVHRWLV